MKLQQLRTVFTQKETRLEDLRTNKNIKGDVYITYYISIEMFITEIYKKFVKYIANTKYVYISGGPYVAICEKIADTYKCVCTFDKITVSRLSNTVEKILALDNIVLKFQVGKPVINYITKQECKVNELKSISYIYLKNAICDGLLNDQLEINFCKNDPNMLTYYTKNDILTSMSIPGAITEKYYQTTHDTILEEYYGNNGRVVYRKVYSQFFDIDYENVGPNIDENFEESFDNSPSKEEIEIDITTVTKYLDNHFSNKYSQIFYINPEEYCEKLNKLFNKYTSVQTDYFFCSCLSADKHDCIAVCKHILGREILCVHIFKTYFPSLSNDVKIASFKYANTKVLLEVGKYIRYLYEGRKFILSDGDKFDTSNVIFTDLDQAIMFGKQLVDNKMEIKINSLDEVLSIEPYVYLREVYCNNDIVYCEVTDNYIEIV